MKNGLLSILLILSFYGHAATVKLESLFLLQPDNVYQENDADPKKLATFIQNAVKEVDYSLQQINLPEGFGFIVMALRGNGEVNAWLDISPSLPESTESQTIMRLRQLPGVQVPKGVLVFAIRVTINDGQVDAGKNPMPKAWRDVLDNNGPMEISALVESIWPR